MPRVMFYREGKVTSSHWPDRKWGEKRHQLAWRKPDLLETARRCNLRTWHVGKP